MNAAPEEENRSNARVEPSVPAAERSIALAGNRIQSRDLFVDTREITIAHEGELYRLRLTAQNKLILTK